MSLKVRGGREASCLCHSRFSQTAHRPEASQLCRSLLQGDGARFCTSWRLTHDSLPIQVWGLALQSRRKSSLKGGLTSSDVFPKLRRCVGKARPLPLAPGETTTRRFQPERKKSTKVEEGIRRGSSSQSGAAAGKWEPIRNLWRRELMLHSGTSQTEEHVWDETVNQYYYRELTYLK